MSPSRKLSPTGARFASLLAGIAIVAVGALGACSERAGDVAPLGPQFAPGGGGPPVKVTGTDPIGAEQEQILDVRVFGSNFEDGSTVEYKLPGVASKVRTNSVTFVSSSELVTNITIDADADLGLYDVEVITPPGKKGVGTELFEVRVKGGGIPSADLSMSGALTAATSLQTVSQDNPQVLELSLTDYAVKVDLSNTYANAVAEWSDPTRADLCRFELPPGSYDREPVAATLIARFLRPDWPAGSVQFYKPAIAAGEEGQDSYIGGGGFGIGRANGGRYYGFLLVTSENNINDASSPRVFRIEAGHGTVRSMAVVEGQKTKDAYANLRCRLMDEITVTVGPSF